MRAMWAGGQWFRGRGACRAVYMVMTKVIFWIGESPRLRPSISMRCYMNGRQEHNSTGY
jgi:hypothetical protein